jgi:TRAP-type C4-dicarboxylate transport system permease small subunit
VLADGPMPRWARLWLVAQAALLAAAFLGAIGGFAWQLWQIASAA